MGVLPPCRSRQRRIVRSVTPKDDLVADQANFLPEYGSPKTRTKDGKRLNCLVRHKEVQATPEESVRQRVLHWLIHDKGWEAGKLRLEHAYKWESDLGRSHVRPDIELLDDEDNVLVVVECKREDVPLDEGVDAQAIGYAIKSYAPYIWVTNGGEHKFLKRDRSGAWDQVPSIEPLGETYEPPTGRIPFPLVSDEDDVKGYLEEHRLGAIVDRDEKRFTLALHHAVFEAAAGKSLPYSHDGVHILEYPGVAFHNFPFPGGRYHRRYADFIAATRGRVEAMSVAVNPWYRGGIRLCVGVTKPERKHHALQLDFAHNCQWGEENKVWYVFHDGRMQHVSNSVVLTAVREAGCGHWIDRYDDGKEWIYLGELPAAGAERPEQWKFLARLLHYGIIRTNLREARSAQS